MIERILGDLSRERFLADHLHRVPYASVGTAAIAQQRLDWDVIDRVLRSSDPAPDVLVARTGALFAGAPPRDGAAARALHDAGWTLVLRHAERHEPGLLDLAEGFRADFGAAVNVHVYATPAGARGFGWHYDHEDVFILVAAGRKTFSLRRNTVQPWPLLETMPRDLGYEREIMPVLTSTLDAGDWIYVPPGFWHRADGETDSLTLAIGVDSPAAIHALDHARAELVRSVLWRQRLPLVAGVAGDGEEGDRERLRTILTELLPDLTRALTSDEGLDHLARELRRRAAPRASG